MAPFALAAGLTQGINVLREAANRVVGIPDLGGSLAGSRRPKKLRLRVAILRDERGKPVAAPEDVDPSLAEARRVLREALAIDLVAAAEPFVRTIAEPAPAAALDSPCAEGSYRRTSARAARSSAAIVRQAGSPARAARSPSSSCGTSSARPAARSARSWITSPWTCPP